MHLKAIWAAAVKVGLVERIARDIVIAIIALVFGHLAAVLSLVVDLEPPPILLRCDLGRAGHSMRRALAVDVVDVARISPHRAPSKKFGVGLHNTECVAAIWPNVYLLPIPHRTLELDRANASNQVDSASSATT